MMTQEKAKHASGNTGMNGQARPRLIRVARLVPALAIVLALGVGQETAVPAAATAATAALPKPPASGEMGFAVVQSHPPFYNGGDKVDCPDGMVGSLRDHYLATLSEAERTRLKRKENEPELESAWKKYGLNDMGGNICTNMYEFMDRPPTPFMKGPVMRGLNLDNDETGEGKDSYTCKHQNFTSPTGEKGIDYQHWRVMGCAGIYRGVAGDGMGDIRVAGDNNMMTGQNTQVIILRRVNSLVNDPDVQVIYANTNDRPAADSSGRPIFHASFTVADGDKLVSRNELHGKIVNGVLTTDVKDIRTGARGRGLARARVRLEFQPDGTVIGLVGGYRDILETLGARSGGLGTVNVAGINCAGQYTATRMMADGDKDPKTGQCRKISVANEIVAIPAFVNDLDPKLIAQSRLASN